MSAKSINFGTDGWRAVIAEEFTFENIDVVAQATADLWKRKRPKGVTKKVVIGYDRRFLADQFAKRVAEVFAGNHFEVILASDAVPTPSVSFAVQAEKAIGGIVLTASHNPGRFCGYKLKGHFGGSVGSRTSKEVERLLEANPIRSLELKSAKIKGLIKFKNLHLAHFKAIRKLIDFNLVAKSGLRFAHDALFGVGAGAFEKILAGTSCKVTTLNGEHDPFFGGIHPEPIVHNYGPSSSYLK